MRGKLGLVLNVKFMLSKSLIQLSLEGQGCIPSLLFDLRPNYGGGNEDNGNLLQKVPCTHCYTQCPQLYNRSPPVNVSARDSWTLTGKYGSVSCGVTTPFSWVLVCTRLCLCPPRGWQPRQHIKKQTITLPTKVHLLKSMVFPVVMYGCESWTIKKAESRRVEVFELWYWRRLLRVPRTARRSSQSILKKINPECSLEGLMLNLKLQYFGHLMRELTN